MKKIIALILVVALTLSLTAILSSCNIRKLFGNDQETTDTGVQETTPDTNNLIIIEDPEDPHIPDDPRDPEDPEKPDGPEDPEDPEDPQKPNDGNNPIDELGLEYTLLDDDTYGVSASETFNLTEVVIPESYNGKIVTQIMVHGFSNISFLEKVTIPSSVTTINDYAFENSHALTAITIPDSVTSIGWSAFLNTAYYNNESNWENYVLYIGNHIIEAKDTLSGFYTVRDETKTISHGAFRECQRLKNITLPNSVTSIGDNAFYYCDSLTGIKIPDSVKYIGNYAFELCSSITEIVIPAQVTKIGDLAFSGCSSLESITVAEGNAVYQSLSNCLIEKESNTLILGCMNSEIPANASITGIAGWAFSGCSSLTSITIPDTVMYIGDKAFSGCENLTEITIPDSVTSIGDSAFRGCRSLKGITIPNGVTRIYWSTFSGCSSLKSITIPTGVTNIEQFAFSKCTALESITIPTSVISIGLGAFDGCSSLVSITVAEGNAVYQSLGNCLIEKASRTLILGCQNSIIPDSGSVTGIARDAFGNCHNLTIITIPDSVTYIGELAFYGCENLTNVILGNGLKGIGSRAFWNCSALESITIPASVISIGIAAFDGCTSLASITVEEGNTVYRSVDNCLIETESKTLILGCQNSTIPEDGSVTSIGDSAFSFCENLTSITIPDYVERIEANAFRGCSNLTSITISDSVQSIGEAAFEYCYMLETINYLGTKSKWNEISKGNYWDAQVGQNTNNGTYTVNFNLTGK